MVEIGTCFKCGGHLKSLSAHILKENEKNPGQNKHLIASACKKCPAIYVNIYDQNWSWLDDAEPEVFVSESKRIQANEPAYVQANEPAYMQANEPAYETAQTDEKKKRKKATSSAPILFKIPVYNDIINTFEELETIPKEQLEAVFSSTEIEAIFRKAKNEKNIRQYYHRARMKYEKFENVFGIKINI
ncbi:MAG: hypothetical protein FWE54_05640 [Methanimicrococcus sp.]|nr:hypothetical protein [Methanimicrococcus sp.]